MYIQGAIQLYDHFGLHGAVRAYQNVFDSAILHQYKTSRISGGDTYVENKNEGTDDGWMEHWVLLLGLSVSS